MTKKVDHPAKKFRTAYGFHDRVTTDPVGASLTKQSFVEDTDINNVVRRFLRTGIPPELMKQNPQWGDFSEMASYQEALNTVHNAQDMFAALPARIRERFRNDPAGFVAFATDPKNGDQLVELGLATKPVSDQPPASSTVLKKEPPPGGGTPPGWGRIPTSPVGAR